MVQMSEKSAPNLIIGTTFCISNITGAFVVARYVAASAQLIFQPFHVHYAFLAPPCNK